MCQLCIEKVKNGDTSVLSRCPDKTGLPMNTKCEFCQMPIFSFFRKDKRISERNRDGNMHINSCAAVFSRANATKMGPRSRKPRIGGFRPEDEL